MEKKPTEEVNMSKKLQSETGTFTESMKLALEETRRMGYKLAVESKCHGVANIVSNETIAFRVVWLVFFLASSGACMYLILYSFFDYFTYDVVSTSRIMNEVPMLFPTVTICSANPITNDVSLAYVEAAAQLDSSFDMIDKYTPARYAISSSWNIPTNNRSVLQSYGLDIDQMIIQAMFDQSPLSLEDQFSWFFDGYYGNCWQFNSGTNYYGNSTSTTFYSTTSGKINGLILEMYAGDLNSYKELATSRGFHITIHNKTLRPVFFQGVDVAVGAETNLAMSREFYSKMPKPYSDCVANIESFGSIFTDAFAQNNLIYSQTFCQILCYNRRLTEVCGCYDTSYPLLTFGKPPCVNATQLSCDIALFQQFFQYEAATNCSQECPIECEKIEYPTSTSFLAYPNDYYYYNILARSDYLALKYFNMSAADFELGITNDNWSSLPSVDDVKAKLSNRLALVNIYYDDMYYTQVEEKAKTSVVDLIASIGGTLGLCLGLSFLAFFELLEFVCRLFIILIPRVIPKSARRSTNKVSAPNVLTVQVQPDEKP